MSALGAIDNIPIKEIQGNHLLAVQDEIDHPYLFGERPKYILWGSDDGDEWVVLRRDKSILQLIREESEDPQPYSRTMITADVFWRKPISKE